MGDGPMFAQESQWWDEHAEPIYVWGELGEQPWHVSVARHLGRLREQALDVGRVLDLGCGLGRLIIPWALHTPDTWLAYGVDASEKMLSQAAFAAQIAGVTNLRLHHNDGRTLPAIDPVDFAWSILLFQHIPPNAQRGYVAAVARLLNPGGRFVVQVHDGETGGEFLHYSTSAHELEWWAKESGLRQVTSETDKEYPQWRWVTFEKEPA